MQVSGCCARQDSATVTLTLTLTLSMQVSGCAKQDYAVLFVVGVEA